MKRNMMIIVGYVLFFIFAQAKSSQAQYFAAEQLISKYGDQNWEYRRQNIQQNRYIINRINSDPNQTYTLAQNSFIIWSQEQFQRNYLRLIPSKPHSIKFAKILSELNTQQVRKSSINKKLMDKAQNVMSIKSLMKRTSDVSNQFLQKYLKFSKMANSNITQELKIKNSSDPIQLIKSYEQKTLAQVRQYLSNKGIFYADDQEAVIQKFRLKSDLQNLSQEQLLSILSKIEKQYEQNQIYQSQFRNEQSLKENKKTRLLQQVQTPSDQQFIEKQIKDVDWSCLSGDVRRQGLCGACYALAVADNIAAMMGIYFFGYHINLSGQDIIYCGDKSLTFGCQGGFIEGAFLYALQNGLLDGYNYPYILQNGWAKPAEKCSQIKKRTPLFKVQGFLEVYQNNFSCKKMMFALQYHPITVGITGFTLTFYKGGVFQCVKEDQQMNHAALLVGYKKGKGWKIKNSWGQGWGQGGYFWLKPGNTCRVCQFGFYPMIDKDLGLQQFKSKTMYATCPLS